VKEDWKKVAEELYKQGAICVWAGKAMVWSFNDFTDGDCGFEEMQKSKSAIYRAMENWDALDFVKLKEKDFDKKVLPEYLEGVYTERDLIKERDTLKAELKDMREALERVVKDAYYVEDKADGDYYIVGAKFIEALGKDQS